jgi:hypothetical protein
VRTRGHADLKRRLARLELVPAVALVPIRPNIEWLTESELDQLRGLADSGQRVADFASDPEVQRLLRAGQHRRLLGYCNPHWRTDILEGRETVIAREPPRCPQEQDGWWER